MSIVEAAGFFGLDADPSIYKSIGRKEADRVVTHILPVSMAYGVKIMSPAKAADLWQQFMMVFEGQDATFVTNLDPSLDSWAPATDATFDMGVLVMGTTRVGCLWVEDED